MSRIIRPSLIAVIAIVAAASSFAAGRTQASANGIARMPLAELNYIQALKTGNEGAKVSAAGYLADYRLTGAVPALIEILRSDKTENVRISAALALVMLGEQEGRAAVQESSLYDGSDRVAQFCDDLLKAHAEKTAAMAAE